MLRIEAFGEIVVRRDGGRVREEALADPALRALVILLAQAGSVGVSRTRAAAMLGASCEWSALVALLMAVFGATYVDVDETHVALRSSVASADVDEFASSLAQGQLERAVQLHRAPLADGMRWPVHPAFDRWIEQQREAFASDAAAALEQLAVDAERRGELLLTVRWWRQLARHQPLNHRIAAALMEALVHAGDREGALRHARFVEALAAEQLSVPEDAVVLSLARSIRDEGAREPADPFSAFRVAIAPRYVLGDEIGRGGQGRVYRAHDRRLERQVALKVLAFAEATPEHEERFLREIRALATLQHPNIVPLFDSGTAAGVAFYVMPLVDGESLRERLRREGSLSLPAALSVARQVAMALVEAHRRGVVHRDIKPENVLLTADAAMLADFGIARVEASATNQQGEPTTPITGMDIVIGTPAYMSPEQVTPGATIDGRADLYGLGCVLYETLTGAPPFAGASPLDVLRAHITVSPDDARVRRPEVPPWLADLLAQLLAKDPAARPPSAQALLDAVTAGEARTAGRRPSGIGFLRRLGVVALVIALLGASILAAPRMPPSHAASASPRTPATNAADRTVSSPRAGEPDDSGA